MARQETTRGVRFTSELLSRLQSRAKRESRSFNQVTLRLLERALAMDGDLPVRDPRMPAVERGIGLISSALQELRLALTDPPELDKGESGISVAPPPVVAMRPPLSITEWEPKEKLRKRGVQVGLANVDPGRPVHETELPVKYAAAAGTGREVEMLPSGETVPVLNPVARQVVRKGWQVVKIIGDSMAPEFGDGEFVYVSLVTGKADMKDGRVYYVLLNGEPLFKILRIDRDAKTKRTTRTWLESYNLNHPDIDVDPENDDFRLVGVYETHVRGAREYPRRTNGD